MSLLVDLFLSDSVAVYWVLKRVYN